MLPDALNWKKVAILIYLVTLGTACSAKGVVSPFKRCKEVLPFTLLKDKSLDCHDEFSVFLPARNCILVFIVKKEFRTGEEGRPI